MKSALLQNFYKLFDLYLPQNICEIGTHNGSSAIQFVDYLFPKVHRLHYTGYDLFDLANTSTDTAEHNGKGPGNFKLADKALSKRKEKYGKRFSYELIKGYTTDTLITPIAYDFVYIDGGHSYETVMHDYFMVKESNVIVFDDYQIEGVKKAIDEITSNLSNNYEVIELGMPERPKRKQLALLKWEGARHNQIALLK
jgi:predicted O-methyltransferase YrrM